MFRCNHVGGGENFFCVSWSITLGWRRATTFKNKGIDRGRNILEAPGSFWRRAAFRISTAYTLSLLVD